MTRLKELEMAITALPQEEYRELRKWFLEKDWETWEGQIEEDSKAGKLDFLVQEALDARKERQLRHL